MKLNPAQDAAVETLTGPLLVLAGAGTGKTRVVTCRVARLIQSGIAPDRILAVTFTNKAAREMQERISKELGSASGPKPEISTFHSLCVRILRRQIHHLGFPNQFSIYDRGDQESVARRILRDIRVASGALKPGDFLSRVSSWKSAGIRPEQALDRIELPQDYICAVAYNRYQNALRELGALDFDDLLLATETLFAAVPEARLQEAGRFDHILVDEYQDTNASQYNIVKSLAQGHRNLCVVGDDDQAIYGWRGAEVRHILRFRDDWPESRVIRLEINYRSTTQILDWANRLIAFNCQRHEKRLRTDRQGERPQIVTCPDGEAEARTVVARIQERLKVPRMRPRDFAVLFRTNEQPRALELEFRSAKIPYILIGGQSFFDRKEVKDVVSWLKLLMRPRDDLAFLRVINTPPRGIGPTTVRKITETAVQAQKPIWDLIAHDPDRLGLDTKSRAHLDAFVQLVRREGGSLRSRFTADGVRSMIERVEYRREVERLYPEKEEQDTRWAAVGEVVSAAEAWLTEHPSGPLSGFLDSTSLGGPEFGSSNDKKLDRDAVVLLTLHAAKGLEFKEVFMVGMEEGTLPHHRSIDEDDPDSVDEERRLCYVGITRAQRRLTLTLAQNRLKWGKLRPTIPSRFLYEVTGQAENPHYLEIKMGETGKKTRSTKQNTPKRPGP